jgi:hypothetical protein
MPHFSSLAKLAGPPGALSAAAALCPADAVLDRAVDDADEEAVDAVPPGVPGGTPRGRPGAGIEAAGAGTMPLEACKTGAADGGAGSSSARLATESTLVAAIKTAHKAGEWFIERSP